MVEKLRTFYDHLSLKTAKTLRTFRLRFRFRDLIKKTTCKYRGGGFCDSRVHVRKAEKIIRQCPRYRGHDDFFLWKITIFAVGADAA